MKMLVRITALGAVLLPLAVACSLEMKARGYTGTPTPAPNTCRSDGDRTSVAHWFPSTMFFNQAIDTAPLDPNSATMITALLSRGGWGNTNRMWIDTSIDVHYTRTDSVEVPFNASPLLPDSDVPATIMLPPAGSTEGFESGNGRASDGGDDHYLVVDTCARTLTEAYNAEATNTSFDVAYSLAVWPFDKLYAANLRGDICTSADAGGFPIAPMLFTVEEVAAKSINHAIRLILPNKTIAKMTLVHPASHGTGGTSWAPASDGIPYGARFRLKGDKDISGLSAGAQVVATAMKKYGMILADGGNIALTAKSDAHSTLKWSDYLGAHDLEPLKPGDFEIVDSGPHITFANYNCTRNP